MRIGIVQIDTVPGAFAQTSERILAQAKRAAEQKADLVVFPLAALAGVALPPFADRPAFLADIADTVMEIAGQLPCPALIAVPIDNDELECGFDALLVDHGKVRPLCMEAYLKAGAAVDETSAEVAEFDLADAHVAVALSYDDLDTLANYDYGADVIIYLSGNPFALDDPSSMMGANLADARFVDDARTCGAWFVGVAPIGGYGDEVFCGSSFVLDPKGNLVAELPAFEEALQVVEVGESSDDAFAHGASVLTPEVFDAPFAAWEAVCLGIQDFVKKQGATDVALTLDGTLASQVLLVLASDALGPLHVHALVGAAAGSGAPACRDLARRLRVDQVDGPGHLADFDAHDLDELSLAALARQHDAVALSALDKTALALGTAAGRVSCATLLPLGDVYRTDVLDMAHMRNTISPLFRRVELGEADAVLIPQADGSVRKLVGERDLTRVDEVLLGYVEYDRPLHDLMGDGRGEDELVDAVLRCMRAHELSRRAQAPVLVMSTHTLDDARGVLGMAWHDEHPDGLASFEPSTLGTDEGMTPAQNDDATQVHESHHTVPSARRHNMPDVAGTLAMLRDLAEQGGFNPVELGAAFNAADAREGSDEALSGGWVSIFSEN